ncbi:class I SAM-dependent methyltransferase [Aeromonas veronii]|uniref:class I SAM-dependent methyltransferase n=1 Tax=Aeromonas veronii TaxID=654 RepID=UPI003F7CBB42
MSKYNVELDLETENSLSIIIKQIRPKARVLEFGPAHGRLTRYLKESLDCIVDIIELDENAGKEASFYARHALIGSELGNIENYQWESKLDGNKYDFIIFADVLEHLYSPSKVLQSIKSFLSNNGVVIISVPNVGHDGVLLELFNEEFNYRDTGLLDDTHIRFFTYQNLLNMVNDSGFIAIKEAAYYAEVLQTEFSKYFTKTTPINFDERVYGNVYQFIFTLAPRERYIAEVNIEKLKSKRDSRHLVKLYIKEAGDIDFSEEKALCARLTDDRVSFNLDKFSNVVELRLDPGEQSGIVSVVDFSPAINLITHNANIKIDRNFIFDNIDPQLLFTVEHAIKDVYFDILIDAIPLNVINKLLLPINKTIKEIESIATLQKKIIIEQQLCLDEINNSKAWKLIAFLKRISNAFIR